MQFINVVLRAYLIGKINSFLGVVFEDKKITIVVEYQEGGKNI